jgi:large subunit ribosomal protein L5e
MAFVKVLKNNVYCSRYQTKYLRRRQGKTDYFARRRLVFQDKNKYDMKKYRLCVRRTNRRIIASVIYATIQGDRTMCQADSQELRRYGITAGLTNYAAAYATGLLVARRLLTLKNMAKIYEGQVKVDGKLFSVWDDIKEDRRPFKANLDVGLVRTTTGNRVFGAMKGACDGGLHVPHSEKRFPGFKIIKQEAVTNKRGKKVEAEESGKKTEYKPEVHKDHIMGGHVQTYYDILKKGDANVFNKQFSQWTKCLTVSKAKNIQDLYAKAHTAIRAKPEAFVKAEAKIVRKVVIAAPGLVQQDSKGRKWLRQQKEATSVKKERIAKVIAAVKAKFNRA